MAGVLLFWWPCRTYIALSVVQRGLHVCSFLFFCYSFQGLKGDVARPTLCLQINIHNLAKKNPVIYQ